MTKYPATKLCHWPAGPVFTCDKHAKALVTIGSAMGYHVGIQIIPDALEHECDNCKNEAEKNQ